MFGGHGIYKDGIIFAIIAYDELFFKVGDLNRADYESRESHPFIYEGGKHKQTNMGYWSVPEEIMNDQELVSEWVDKAVQVSKDKKK